MTYNSFKVMHSHDYRSNSEFRGKNVAVLGAAASGQDMGLEIAQAAAKVWTSWTASNVSNYMLTHLDVLNVVK